MGGKLGVGTDRCIDEHAAKLLPYILIHAPVIFLQGLDHGKKHADDIQIRV